MNLRHSFNSDTWKGFIQVKSLEFDYDKKTLPSERKLFPPDQLSTLSRSIGTQPEYRVMATETMISWRGGKMWVAEFMKHIEINITWDFDDLVTLLYRDGGG